MYIRIWMKIRKKNKKNINILKVSRLYIVRWISITFHVGSDVRGSSITIFVQKLKKNTSKNEIVAYVYQTCRVMLRIYLYFIFSKKEKKFNLTLSFKMWGKNPFLNRLHRCQKLTKMVAIVGHFTPNHMCRGRGQIRTWGQTQTNGHTVGLISLQSCSVFA